jgi:tetratricopeptide (TPR) repeat protein
MLHERKLMRGLALIAAVAALTLAIPRPALADRDDEDCFNATLDETGERAIAVCGRILARGKVKDRDLARTLNNRGLGYVANKQLDKAMADFDAAVRVDPTYPFAFDNRGDVWRQRGEFERAITEYNEALRRDPDFVSAYVNRGMTYEAMGNKASARADYQTVVNLPAQDRAIDKWAKEVARERLKSLGTAN